MFANVGQENPAKGIFTIAISQQMRADDLVSFLPILLEKHDMAPRRCAKVSGVVVRISRPRETVIRHVIPFFARDFASFAADANGRVGEEADLYFLLYEIVMALVGAFRAFADHGLCGRVLLWFGNRRLACRSRRHRRKKFPAHSFPSVA